MTTQQTQVPWWRNDPFLGRQRWYENREKNAHLLADYDEMYVAW